MDKQQSTQGVLGTVTAFPSLKPDHSLVPARVGRSIDTSVIVFIECPTTWCDEDHLGEPVSAVADVMHRNSAASVDVPTFGYGVYPVQMHAWIESDPTALDPNFRAAHISVSDANGGDGAHITPDTAERLADDLIGFASELRTLARTARLHNAAAEAEAVVA